MSSSSRLRTVTGQLGRAGAVAALMMAGACSLPDWADPGSYFEPDYGPAPQPVARAGGEAVPANRPASGLAAASENVQRSGEKKVIAVTESSATTPTPATPSLAASPERVEKPAPQAPAPTQTARASTSTPVVQRPVNAAAAPSEVPPPKPRGSTAPAAPEPQQTARVTEPEPRAPSRSVAGSPTPMIAAMTRGQQPPSFSEDGSVVSRRTDVQPNVNIDSGSSSGTVNEPAPRRTAAATAPVRQPAAEQPAVQPSRTFEQAVGESGGAAQVAVGNGPVQPGQFPGSVPSVVRQNYQDYLSAPRTYQDVIGGSSGGSVASGSPVVISGGGVQQQTQVLTGAAGGADAVIRFGHNSARLSSNDETIIRRIAEQAKSRQARVRVRGHSSSRTGQMAVESHLLANLRISARRAEAVADALARYGVPYERIIVEAKGDNTPIYNEAMPAGEAGNRRAEIFLEN